MRPFKGALTQCEVKDFSKAWKRLFWLFKKNDIIHDKKL
jgi:hypothetical protein